MRILTYCYEYPPFGGGAGSALAELARQWTDQGHEVSVVTGSRARSVEGTGRSRIIRLATGRRRRESSTFIERIAYMAEARRTCERIYEQVRPEVLVNFFALPGSGDACLYLKKRYGLPFVTQLRGSDVPGPGSEGLSWIYAAAGPFLRRICRESSAVIAVGQDLAGRAVRAYGIRGPVVIPNGVDTERYKPAERAEEGVVNVLYCGRLLESQKRLSTLLRALASARGVRLDVVGDGPDRRSYEALVRRLDVSGIVRFHGWIDKSELPSWYARAHIFVNASPAEGMPNAVLEAMASSCALLLSDIPTHHEIASEPDNALFFAPSDPEALASKLRALAANPGLRRRMGEYNRRRVLEQHHWPVLASRHLDVLRSVVA
ncbi:MAG: Glycogen synthase [Candidatus Omnitrophica bacterium]|nr:Glycogen synthase [Candidatus Omnitrophota bacterium]